MSCVIGLVSTTDQELEAWALSGQKDDGDWDDEGDDEDWDDQDYDEDWDDDEEEEEDEDFDDDAEEWRGSGRR